jgi:hypothetical protein
MKSMGVEELQVQYMGIRSDGKHQLSRKAVLEGRNGKSSPPNGESVPSPAPAPLVEMSVEELDVIVNAIEGVEG